MNVKVIADVREHEQSRVAVIEDGKLAEVFIEFNCDDDGTLDISRSKSVRNGDIFKARVETLVPAISAAFVKLSPKSHGAPKGSGNAFMYVNEAKSPGHIRPGHELIVQVIKLPVLRREYQFPENGSSSSQTARKQECPKKFLTLTNANASNF